ncbi:hypothetical protein ACRE_005770 [Hapsidospora chrysogenum ATCC 11550]|uniref:Uncharacterized protein n=1 Tax=Hapsidospora chrysogenum (strain ATCC 11550 / CBS 779.69 / DSM 880 / IAM 14645 / JCM 23072 / IMI 49137) TaxID=857340 RepID=A0A086TGS2_HAPC1|nr:hypothetical protein ACRE_005770 [Hapsidospora chrysogenum ATCC 11550]
MVHGPVHQIVLSYFYQYVCDDRGFSLWQVEPTSPFSPSLSESLPAEGIQSPTRRIFTKFATPSNPYRSSQTIAADYLSHNTFTMTIPDDWPDAVDFKDNFFVIICLGCIVIPVIIGLLHRINSCGKDGVRRLTKRWNFSDRLPQGPKWMQRRIVKLGPRDMAFHEAQTFLLPGEAPYDSPVHHGTWRDPVTKIQSPPPTYSPVGHPPDDGSYPTAEGVTLAARTPPLNEDGIPTLPDATLDPGHRGTRRQSRRESGSTLVPGSDFDVHDEDAVNSGKGEENETSLRRYAASVESGSTVIPHTSRDNVSGFPGSGDPAAQDAAARGVESHDERHV